MPPMAKKQKKACTTYQLYDNIKDKLVIGENIRPALNMHRAALPTSVYRSLLALSPAMQQTVVNTG